jgi:outer membrane protein OmpA-like peptidoglycan-associated protein
MSSRITPLVALAVLGALAPASVADAQILDRLRRTAEQAVEKELTQKVRTVVGDATACAVGNRECVEQARRNGDKIVIVDGDGAVITDENGNPVTDPVVAASTRDRPGEGRWANYDFLRGERPIYNSRWNIEDVDNPPALVPNRRIAVGRIPGNLDFGRGSMQIVQLDGLNTAEFTAETRFRVPLAEPLPEDFSLEFTVDLAAPNAFVDIYFDPFLDGGVRRDQHEYNYLSIWRAGGIYFKADRVSGGGDMWNVATQLTPVKFQVDDGYGILYVAGERVAQVPNFRHPVGSTVLEFKVNANQNSSAYIRDIRVDYGVDNPYERFAAEGVYTTRSIFFDFNSSEIRPESTPELERLRTMLGEYREAVVVEGHTDAVGSDAYNQQLSQGRAEAVKAYLVGKGSNAALIQAVGKGETEPIADNETDDGRQANRRVVVRAAAK